MFCDALNRKHEEYIRKHIAQQRLEDVIAVSEKYYLTGKKQREVCFFVRLFSQMAGYSKGAANELAAIINSRFRSPLHLWELESVLGGTDKFFCENNSLSYYSNEKLVDVLELRGLEKTLGLKTIMSAGERRRRKAIRDAASYASRRGGPSKKDKIKSRINAMARRLLNGTLNRKSFQSEYGIGRSTYYTDLKMAKRIAYRILITCVGVISQPRIIAHRQRYMLLLQLLPLLLLQFHRGNGLCSSACNCYRGIIFRHRSPRQYPIRPPDIGEKSQSKKFRL